MADLVIAQSNEDEPERGAQPATRPAALTARSVVLGMLGATQVAIIQVSTEVKPSIVVPPFASGPYTNWYAILPGAIFWLFLVAIFNAGLKRWRPRSALRPPEFAAIFGMTTVAAAIASFDELLNLLPTYMFPFRVGQDASMWPYRQFIPPWIAPQSPGIVKDYFHGNVSFWTWERWRVWALPLACWMSYLTALGATMWAWNVILRRRWIDRDRLAFPNVQVPLEMCRAAGFGGMVAGKLFWSGFITAAVIESLAHLHQRLPQIPALPATIDFDPMLTGAPPPWDALWPVQPVFSMLHVGISYFIPLELLFSSTFFFLFRKGLEVFGRAQGWRTIGWDVAGFPFARSQSAGAWAALFFLLIWAERHHLWRVLKSAFSPRGETFDDAREPGSYRWAGRILVGGTAFLILFSVAGGMSLPVSVAFYGLFWMINVTATRVYAQVGPPTLELYYADPQRTLTTIFGNGLLSPSSATHLSLLYWLTRTNSGHPMAHQLSAFFVGKETNASMRGIGRVVLFGFVFGAFVCLLAYLHYAYRVGEDQWQEGGWHTGTPAGAVGRLTGLMASHQGPQWVEISYMFVGAGVTLALSKAMFTITGFPLHPLGFALAMCWGVEYTWGTFLLMWIFKGLTLRYGGRRQYQIFIPFFLGLTLAGLVTPAFWGLVAWGFHWFS